MARGGARPGSGRPKGSKDSYPRPARVSTESVAHSQRQVLAALKDIERQLGHVNRQPHAEQLGEIHVLLKDNVLRRLVAIERALGLVEHPKTPHIGRRQPLEG